MPANADGLRELVRQRAAQLAQDAGQAVVDELRATSPVDSGYLQQSILDPTPLVGQETVGVIVQATADYASYVNDGTAPHRIEGNPLLSFDTAGGHVVVHFVDHPGTRPTDWWDNAVGRWGEFLQAAV